MRSRADKGDMLSGPCVVSRTITGGSRGHSGGEMQGRKRRCGWSVGVKGISAERGNRGRVYLLSRSVVSDFPGEDRESAVLPPERLPPRTPPSLLDSS